ncbi:MAG: hypothetical protein INQ03_25860 [Candidatus Heimdallarchaeota archaeon]|nr:hypothetical protein [Candidatus Heimdallarchaeota archaeon]
MITNVIVITWDLEIDLIDSTIYSGTVQVNVSSNFQANYSIYINGSLYSAVLDIGNFSFYIDTTLFENGEYNLTLEAFNGHSYKYLQRIITIYNEPAVTTTPTDTTTTPTDTTTSTEPTTSIISSPPETTSSGPSTTLDASSSTPGSTAEPTSFAIIGVLFGFFLIPVLRRRQC